MSPDSATPSALETKRRLPQLRAWDGALTEQLVRQPGRYGLGQVPSQLAPDATTGMICGFCATGCGLNLHLKDGEAVNLSPDTDYPVNLGMACPKGWEALTPLEAEDRATRPLCRTSRDAELLPVGWDQAADSFCQRMKAVQAQHGSDSVAFLGTGQICSEEMAFLGAFAKFGMGVLHGDGNTRQCMATSVRSYKESFGFDAPPYTYADFEESDVIVLIGSNLCIAHPILWQRVLRNRRNAEIIVIDPRRTETAMAGSRHVPLAPKSDLQLYYGLAHLLIRDGRVDRDYIAAHTEDYEAFAKHVEAFDLERTSRATGLPREELESLARTLGDPDKRVSYWWTMGVNQGYEAVRTAQSIINLALMTGNIGRPGTGANSITGQCNAMGSRLFSNTTCLPGGRRFESAEDRQFVAETFGIPEARIPRQESWAYDQIVQGIHDGKIKALWVVATNGSHSWIQQDGFNEALDKLDFLVVQDLYHSTETARRADLLLPAAGWAEKDGTFINSERRIGLVKKVRRAPGQALADFSIVRLLAQRWGCGDWFREWTSPEAVFQLLKRTTKGQPCDITGIRDYRMLDEAGGIQWPHSGGEATTAAEGDSGSDANGENNPAHPAQERRLFEDGRFYTPNGRAKFCFTEVQPEPEPVDEIYPLRLLTGRGSSAQWHTETRSAKSAVLRKLQPEGLHLEIHPDDAERLGVEPGGKVQVVSRRGDLEARAFVTPTVQPGQVFLPMHSGATNRLTKAVFDPHSRQPSYKDCAVRVEPLES